jgi:hypothetical protein
MWRYALLNVLLLCLSAPWIFIGSSPELQIEGFSFWSVAFLYAIFVAVGLTKHWDDQEGSSRDD